MNGHSTTCQMTELYVYVWEGYLIGLCIHWIRVPLFVSHPYAYTYRIEVTIVAVLF